jgi:parvulin-like peptidyl-prolyl isomerase
MKDTSDRDRIIEALSVKRAKRAGLAVLFMLALLLVGCGSNGKTEQPSTASDRGEVIVSTVAPSRGAPSATPFVPTPTALPTPTPPAPLAALVNGKYVFLADYEAQVEQYTQALVQAGVDFDTEDGQARLALAKRDVLEGMIDNILIEDGAAALGISVSDEELAAQVDSDITSGGGKAAFEAWLAATDLTQEEYEVMLRQSMLAQRAWDLLTADVPEAAEQVHVRHIVVDTEEAAQEIITQLQQGADFVALARDHSLDEATKDNGGDLDWFPRGVIAPELENAAFALQPGQISEAIALAGQFQILQVMERETDRPLSDEMLMQLKQDRFNRWLENLRASAVIERFVSD